MGSISEKRGNRMAEGIARRNFLSKLVKGGAVLPFFRYLDIFASDGSPGPGSGLGKGDVATVVEVYHPEATIDMSVQAEVVATMVDLGILTLTGEETVGEAWASIFPVITANSMISIKINTISNKSSHLTVHPELVYAITSGLQLMQLGRTDFPAENIIIWDRREDELINAGFEINTSDEGVKCMACNSPGVGFDTSYPMDVSGKLEYPCTILTEQCDYLINIALVKDHYRAEGTFTLKNHYGSVKYPGALHADSCDPYAAALNADPLFEEKTTLVMLDSLFGVYNGGPVQYPQEVYNTIHFATDRVAIDACGKDILNETRLEKGLSAHDVPHIATAESLGVGTTNYVIDRVTPTGIDERSDQNRGAPGVRGTSPILYQNSPNPFNPTTLLRFDIPGSSSERTPVNLSIFDTRGRLVKRLLRRELAGGCHSISWNGIDDHGKARPSGIYTAVLEATGKRIHRRMLLVK